MKMKTKNERYTFLAMSRTCKIIQMLDLLGECADRYEYSEKHAAHIFGVIEKHLKSAKEKFLKLPGGIQEPPGSETGLELIWIPPMEGEDREKRS